MTDRTSRPALRLLSLGAGVQSTTVLLLACDGAIPRFDYAVFADPSWEPRAVYENLARLRAHAGRAGIRVRTISAGNIRTDALDPQRRFVSMPLHVLNADGSPWLARRQCTSEYKIRPLKKAARQLLGYPHPRRIPRGLCAEQAIGINTDEVARAKDSGVSYLRNVFPLITLGWDCATCVDYLTDHGFGHTVKSACVGCPFHEKRQLALDPRPRRRRLARSGRIRQGYPSRIPTRHRTGPETTRTVLPAPLLPATGPRRPRPSHDRAKPAADRSGQC
jgi:hypothetical protein